MQSEGARFEEVTKFKLSWDKSNHLVEVKKEVLPIRKVKEKSILSDIYYSELRNGYVGVLIRNVMNGALVISLA